MIMLDDMNPSVKKLKTNTKCRKSEIGRLCKDDYRSFWKGNKLILYLLNLRIKYESFFILKVKLLMMIESDFYIFCNIM